MSTTINNVRDFPLQFADEFCNQDAIAIINCELIEPTKLLLFFVSSSKWLMVNYRSWTRTLFNF